MGVRPEVPEGGTGCRLPGPPTGPAAVNPAAQPATNFREAVPRAALASSRLRGGAGARLQHVLGEILVFENTLQPLTHVGGRDGDGALAQLGRLEGQLIE